MQYVVGFSCWPVKRLVVEDGRLYVKSCLGRRTEILPDEIVSACRDGLSPLRRYLVLTTRKGKYAAHALSKHCPRVADFVRSETCLKIGDTRRDMLSLWRVLVSIAVFGVIGLGVENLLASDGLGVELTLSLSWVLGALFGFLWHARRYRE